MIVACSGSTAHPESDGGHGAAPSTGGTSGATGGARTTTGGAPTGTGGTQAGSGGTQTDAGGAQVGMGGANTGMGGDKTGTGGDPEAGSGGASDGALAAKYPGDVGIAKDPAVVWVEDFEEANPAAMFARYDDAKREGLAFDGDVPAKSHGKASAKLTAKGEGPNAVDFYKKLPDQEELYVRYYAKYQSGAPWHHTGVWIGGYNPSMSFPSPQAGLKPNGDDRLSVSLEPIERGQTPRMDFYNYWMQMRSWMDVPMGDTAYYGNSLVHEPKLVAKDEWQCIELHLKLNPNPGERTGAELGLFVDDASIMQFTDQAPLGYWVKDKFCPDHATGTECTDYRPDNPTLVPLDMRFRSTALLKLNAFWPQNYITDTGEGSVYYDDMVVAKVRIGCLR